MNSHSHQHSEDDAGDTAADGVIAFDHKASIMELMKSHKGDFDHDLFANLLTRPDLPHLLLTDVEIMTQKLV